MHTRLRRPGRGCPLEGGPWGAQLHSPTQAPVISSFSPVLFLTQPPAPRREEVAQSPGSCNCGQGLLTAQREAPAGSIFPSPGRLAPTTPTPTPGSRPRQSLSRSPIQLQGTLRETQRDNGQHKRPRECQSSPAPSRLATRLWPWSLILPL